MTAFHLAVLALLVLGVLRYSSTLGRSPATVPIPE
jgi:hypothetical protein